MAAESSGTPEVKSIEENRRKRKRLTAVLDKLTSQAQGERESKPGPSTTTTGGDEAGDVSPKIHVSGAAAAHSWSSVSESCPSGDEGSISERSPFSPSGESASSVSDITSGVVAETVQKSRLDVKKPSTTKPEVFRFDTIARETFRVSEEVQLEGNKTPPIVEFLQELGVRSPRSSRQSPPQSSMQTADQGTSLSSAAFHRRLNVIG